jgi:LacI family transcriptional regulator
MSGAGESMPGSAKRLITLREVAAAAEVDVSTVSRVLKNTGRASEETRARIFAAAAKLGYRANPAARALKTAHAETLLMVVPQIENPIFASAIIAAETEARQSGYALLVAYDRGGMGREIIEDISRSSLIEGVIIASFDEDDRLRHTLVSIQQPYMVINRVLPGDGGNCIAIDTCCAARMGVAYLIEIGHRRIGHLAGRLGHFNGDARRRGWAEAMAAAGLQHDVDLVKEAGYDPDRVPAAVDALLAAGVTAIHAATLLTGAAAIARLHAVGLHVPRDISVVTMHDDLLARVVHPEITTVALPTEEMGRAAVRSIVERIEGKASASPPKRKALMLSPKSLIVRGSAAPPQK